MRQDRPGFIAITPNGRTAYVASVAFSDNTVITITTATNTTGPPIHVGSFTQAMAITPNGTTLYVVSYASDTVTPITTTTNIPCGCRNPVQAGHQGAADLQ